MTRFESYLWELVERGILDGERYSILLRGWDEEIYTAMQIMQWLRDCCVISQSELLCYTAVSACDEACTSDSETVQYA